MTSRDVFALIVRVAGLGLVVCAIFDLFHVGFAEMGLLDSTTVGRALLGAFDYGVVGLALLVGARPITRWVYGEGP